MNADIRRIVAIEAHRRRTGRCPTVIHSLGTGETFEVHPTPNGFVDLDSGISVQRSGDEIVLPTGAGSISLRLDGDVTFSGYLPNDQESFTGRAGGGASVTVYDPFERDFYQYAIDSSR